MGPFFRTTSGDWRCYEWIDFVGYIPNEFLSYCNQDQFSVDSPGDFLETHSDLIHNEFAKMRPSVNEGLSLANFLLELKDLPKLFSTIFKKNLKFKHALSDFSQYSEELKQIAWLKASGRPYRHLYKRLGHSGAGLKSRQELDEFLDGPISDNILAINFGYKPLVSDFLSTIDLAKNYVSRIENLLNNESKPLSRSRRITLQESVSTTSFATNHPWIQSNGYGQMVHEVTTRKIVSANLTLKYSYALPAHFHSGGADATCRKIIQLLGLDLRPDVIWNAIPWSFLADYVGNFSQFAAYHSSGFSSLNIHATIVTIQITESKTIVSKMLKRDGISYEGHQTTGHIEKISKERFILTSDWSRPVLVWKSPNWVQKMNIAALLRPDRKRS